MRRTVAAVVTMMVLSAPVYGQTLLAAGDIGNCSVTTDTQVGNLIRSQAGTFLALGDLAYNDGTAAQFNTCYDQPYAGLKPRTKPVPGNHDYNTPGAAGYFGYFGAVANGPRGYYAYNVGEWRVYALNTGCSIGGACFGSAQLTWLRADLAASPQRCKLAYMHHPRWSSGAHGNGNSATARAFQALYDGRVSVVLAGHDHHYERFAPQTPSGSRSDTRGVRQFVVGTGGTTLRATTRVGTNSQSRAARHGVLRLQLGAASYSWQFLPISGSAGDTGSAACVSGG